MQLCSYHRPLPPNHALDVIGLVRKDGRDRRIDTDHGQAEAKVLDPCIANETHDGNADDGDQEQTKKNGSLRFGNAGSRELLAGIVSVGPS